MNLQKYLDLRKSRTDGPAYRTICRACWKALPTCFCTELKPFKSPIDFVIVQHLVEARNPIATARMAHLSITNSTLIMDNNFEGNLQVKRMLEQQSVQNYILYPSPEATPLEQLWKDQTLKSDKKPVFWVVDTTWSHATKMMKQSPELQTIPMVKFNPDRPSQFQIRKQPHALCLSTIESIYLVIDQYQRLHHQTDQSHQNLIDVFQYMVQQQIKYGKETNNMRHAAMRRKRAMKAQAKS